MESSELPLVFRKSKRPFVVTLIGATVAAVILFLLPDIYSHPLRFGMAYAFCAIASGCVLLLVEGKPDLVISEEGIQASDWGDTLVHWEEIDHAFVVSRKGVNYMCLTLLHAEDFRGRSGAMAKVAVTTNRAIGLGDLIIRPSTLRLDAQELIKLVQFLISISKSSSRLPPSAVRYRMN